MQKDFDRYNKSGKGTALFHEREVWWCSLGMNIGLEQDGSTDAFARPVMISKPHDDDVALFLRPTTVSEINKFGWAVVANPRQRAAVRLLELAGGQLSLARR